MRATARTAALLSGTYARDRAWRPGQRACSAVMPSALMDLQQKHRVEEGGLAEAGSVCTACTTFSPFSSLRGPAQGGGGREEHVRDPGPSIIGEKRI